MKEEELIRQHDTGRNPFQTPDGYFESFTSRLMERMERERLTSPVHEASKVERLNLFRRIVRYAAAAVFVGVCIGAGAYLYLHQPVMDASMDATEFVFNDENLDDVLDYELLDNNKIAYYLTEAY
ncbi:MAG: hypothetical protein J6W75_09310 [Bacteroidaceae bacterium]|nr:hypothetical protein [Bacteroidaceae bacterium]